MTTVLRIVLIVASLLTLLGVIKRVRNARMRIESTVFWVVFAFMLLFISIFPKIAEYAAALLGIYSTVNFVFLFVIFVLMIHLFFIDIKISQQEEKINELIETIAIKEYERDRK